MPPFLTGTYNGDSDTNILIFITPLISWSHDSWCVGRWGCTHVQLQAQNRRRESFSIVLYLLRQGLSQNPKATNSSLSDQPSFLQGSADSLSLILGLQAGCSTRPVYGFQGYQRRSSHFPSQLFYPLSISSSPHSACFNMEQINGNLAIGVSKRIPSG